MNSRNRMGSAQEQLMVVFLGFFKSMMDLQDFYGTTVKSLNLGKPQIQREYDEAARESLDRPELKQAIQNNLLGSGEEFVDRLSKAMAQRADRVAVQTVHSASLVFAHSLLDGVLSDCCKISFHAVPEDWHRFVEKRKIEISLLQKMSADQVINQTAWEFVCDLERQSIIKRLQTLNQVCVPRLEGQKNPTAWLAVEKLEEFDDMRHKIIHGQPFSQRVPSIEDQLFFAKTAGFSALTLVFQAYKLSAPFDKTQISFRRVLRYLVILRREFPEFIAMFNGRL